MGIFKDLLKDLDCFFTSKATIKSVTPVRNATDGTYTQEIKNKLKNISVAFWKAGEGDKYIDGKLDPDVTGVLIVNPIDLKGVELEKSDQFIVDGNTYSGVDPENVMNFNEMYKIKLKRHFK